ncbi:MAG: DUF1648 domain-containing protein [Holophagaceae bacterium]
MGPAIRPDSESSFSPWDVAALVAILALAALALALWPSLPDPLPTHWNAAGRVNGWTPRAGVPWILFGLPVLVWSLLAVVGRLTPSKDPALAAASRRILAPLRGLLVAGICVLQSAVLLVPRLGPGVFRPLLAGFVILLVLAVALMARMAKRVLPEAHRATYKWGLFYVNAEDPRLLVPKLLGAGWTFNYARPAAWWITALLLLLPLAPWPSPSWRRRADRLEPWRRARTSRRAPS